MMRSVIRSAALALILAVLAAPGPASAVPTVYLEPVDTTVSVGQEFDVRLMINDEADTISNFQVIIRFDPNILQMVGVEEGSLYVTAGYETFFHVEEESLGTWEIFEVIFPYTSFILTPGELAVIRFGALANGETPIQFLSAVVMDIDRVEIQPLGSVGGHVAVMPEVGVGSAEEQRTGWAVGAPYPNPSRGSASVRLARPWDAGGACALSVYDARGRLVRSLDVPSPGGHAEVVWDGRDDHAREVSSGVYFFRLETPEERIHRKIIFLR
jgi:hypothetical protein